MLASFLLRNRGKEESNNESEITDPENASDQETHIIDEARREISALVIFIFKFATFVTLLLMLYHQSPVSDVHPINRAVKDTFQVEDAMDVMNIHDTWDWVRSVLDRISSHSKQSFVDSIPAQCQGPGKLFLQDNSSDLSAAYSNADLYECATAKQIRLDETQVFAAPNNNLLSFTISQKRSLLYPDCDICNEEDKLGFDFDSAYHNKPYYYSTFGRAIDATLNDPQVLGIFGDLETGDDDRDYYEAAADQPNSSSIIAKMCVFSDAFEPESSGPNLNPSTLHWRGTFVEIDSLNGLKVPAFYHNYSSWIMAATNNEPKSSQYSGSPPAGNSRIELNPCWVVISPNTSTADMKQLDALGYTQINEGYSIDVPEDGNFTENDISTWKLLQSPYVPDLSSDLQNQFGIKKIVSIARWSQICITLTNDGFIPLENPVAGGIFGWHATMENDKWLEDVCKAVFALDPYTFDHSYGFFAWPVTSSLMTPSQADTSGAGAAPAEHYSSIYTDQVMVLEPSLGLGRFLLDRGRINLNEMMDWIDGNTRTIDATMIAFNGNNYPAVSVMMMEIKYKTTGDVRADFDVAMVPLMYMDNPYGNNTNLGFQVFMFFFISILGLYILVTLLRLTREEVAKSESVLWTVIGVLNHSWLWLDIFSFASSVIHIIHVRNRNRTWSVILKKLFNRVKGSSDGASEFSTQRQSLFIIDLTKQVLQYNKTMKFWNLVMVLMVTFQMLFAMGDFGSSLGMPMMGVVTRTLSVCTVTLLPLLIVFIITLVTFGVTAHLTFGLRLNEFRTIWTSMGEVCLMLMGGGPDATDFSILCYDSGENEFCYANVYLFYWMFVLINTILLLNMVLAVVFSVYDNVRDEINAANKDQRKLSIMNSAAILLHFVEPKQMIQEGMNLEKDWEPEDKCMEMEPILGKDGRKDSEIAELKRTVGDLHAELKSTKIDLNEHLNLLRESLECMKSELKTELSSLHNRKTTHQGQELEQFLTDRSSQHPSPLSAPPLMTLTSQELEQEPQPRPSLTSRKSNLRPVGQPLKKRSTSMEVAS